MVSVFDSVKIIRMMMKRCLCFRCVRLVVSSGLYSIIIMVKSVISWLVVVMVMCRLCVSVGSSLMIRNLVVMMMKVVIVRIVIEVLLFCVFCVG